MAESTTMARPPRLLRCGKGNIDTRLAPPCRETHCAHLRRGRSPPEPCVAAPHLVRAPPPLLCPHHCDRSHWEYQELLQHAHHGRRSTVELTHSSNWALAITVALSRHADEPTPPFTVLGEPLLCGVTITRPDAVVCLHHAMQQFNQNTAF